MSDFLPPPTHIEPFTLDEATGRWMFSPIWMQWFINVSAFISSSGGGGGGAADHESLAGLLGGAVGQHYHTDNTQYTELVGNKAAHLVYAGPTAGGATTPAFRVLVPGDIPTGAVVAFGLDGEDGELGDQGVPGSIGPAGQSIMGPPGLDGESADIELFGFGVTGVSVTGANGIGVSGSPITSSGTIGLSLGAITPTSVSTPSIITASGALTVTPAAGSGVNVALSGAGDFVVNTNQLYVDTSTSNVGVGTTSPGYALDVESGNMFVSNGVGANNGKLYFPSNGTLPFVGTAANVLNINGGSYIARVVTANSSSGNQALEVQGSASVGYSYANTTPPANGLIIQGNVGIGTAEITTIGSLNHLQVAGTTAATNSLGISAWSADALGSRIELGKSRGAAIGTNTIVVDGDVVGSLLGYGANGSTFTNLASISMEVDGTPGATNDMPGRIVFKTTPNGSGTLTEAMRLSQDQTALFASSIKTAAPTTGTAAPWKLGTLVTGQVGLVVLSTQYLEVDVSGSLVKLATI